MWSKNFYFVLDYALEDPMNNYIEIISFALVLSADSFSAAIAMGIRKHNWKDSLKFALTSGGIEGLVAFIGAIGGAGVLAQFDFIDHWISFFILLAVAIHMMLEAYGELKSKEKAEEPKLFHSYIKILLVSFATSLDAFAIGITLGISGKEVGPYVIAIGAFAFLSTIVGMAIAQKAFAKLGAWLSFVGSFVLLLLAIKFLSEGLA